MAEFTDIYCLTPTVAQLVVEYLHREIANEDYERPAISAEISKSVVRVTYHDLERHSTERQAWDMQLMGFRDGAQQVLGEQKHHQ